MLLPARLLAPLACRHLIHQTWHRLYADCTAHCLHLVSIQEAEGLELEVNTLVLAAQTRVNRAWTRCIRQACDAGACPSSDLRPASCCTQCLNYRRHPSADGGSAPGGASRTSTTAAGRSSEEPAPCSAVCWFSFWMRSWGSSPAGKPAWHAAPACQRQGKGGPCCTIRTLARPSCNNAQWQPTDACRASPHSCLGSCKC